MKPSEMLALYNRSFPRLQTDEATFCQRLMLHDGSLVFEHMESGGLAGFSVVNDDGILLLCVDPAHRGRGIGSALLTRSENHISRHFTKIQLGVSQNTYLLCGVPMDGGCDYHSFFEKHGYTRRWIGCDMVLDLERYTPVPERAPMDGIAIRRCGKENGDLEKAVLCAGEINGWGALYAAAASSLIIAVAGTAVVGGVIVSPEPCLFSRSVPKAGSFGCLGVTKAFRNRGIGARLCHRALSDLKAAGCAACYIGYTYLDRWYGKLGAVKYMEYWMGEK